jgi:hypothetical protein
LQITTGFFERAYTYSIVEAELRLLSPWKTPDPDPVGLVLELTREVGPDHPLYSKPVKPLALASDRDDVLFEVTEGTMRRYAVVHLTWSGRMERTSTWPETQFFDSLTQWLEWMKADHEEYIYGDEDHGKS